MGLLSKLYEKRLGVMSPTGGRSNRAGRSPRQNKLGELALVTLAEQVYSLQRGLQLYKQILIRKKLKEHMKKKQEEEVFRNPRLERILIISCCFSSLPVFPICSFFVSLAALSLSLSLSN